METQTAPAPEQIDQPSPAQPPVEPSPDPAQPDKPPAAGETEREARRSAFADAAMNTPRVSDRVVYMPRILSGNDRPEPQAAIITRVWSPTCVNLRVLSDNSDTPAHRTSVIRRCSSNEDLGGYWDWP